MTTTTAAAADVPRNVTYSRVLKIALPVVLSNATVPLQGAIDTAIIGNLGRADLLAAVALGGAVISLLLGVFNFLQIGCSGLTAQAKGADDRRWVMNTLVRAIIIALVIAALLIALQAWLIPLTLAIFEGSTEVEALAAEYLTIRLWGSPAELANYALLGWFTGQELTRRLFEMQIVISAVNISLNVLFVLGLGMGITGLALATAIAAYTGLAYGLWRAARQRKAIAPGWRVEAGRILEPTELARVMALNRDIFIRTLCLIGSFTWMTRLGSTQGDLILAVNGVLWQFFHVAAYALDGFAMAAETLVGQAIGARDRARLRRSVIVSATAALGLAAIVAVVFSLAGPSLIRLFTTAEEVRTAAYGYVLWVTLLPVVGVLAFQADGVFFGAAEGPAMRNAMLLSAAIYVPAAWALTEGFGNHGLWAAMWLFMAIRALTLALQYPALERRAATGQGSG